MGIILADNTNKKKKKRQMSDFWGQNLDFEALP